LIFSFWADKDIQEAQGIKSIPMLIIRVIGNRVGLKGSKEIVRGDDGI
jgi:hypothetical protein